MKSIRNWFQAACVRYEWLKLLYAMVRRFNWVRVPEMAASLLTRLYKTTFLFAIFDLFRGWSSAVEFSNATC